MTHHSNNKTLFIQSTPAVMEPDETLVWNVELRRKEKWKVVSFDKIKMTPSGSSMIQHLYFISTSAGWDYSRFSCSFCYCYFCTGVQVHDWSGQEYGRHAEEHEPGKGKRKKIFFQTIIDVFYIWVWSGITPGPYEQVCIMMSLWFHRDLITSSQTNKIKNIVYLITLNWEIIFYNGIITTTSTSR